MLYDKLYHVLLISPSAIKAACALTISPPTFNVQQLQRYFSSATHNRMKIFLLLLSTLALSSIVLAMPTTNQEKKLLETLLGEKHDNLALEQDMGQDLPYGISKPNRAEKMDIIAKLQALKKEAETNAEAQFLGHLFRLISKW